MFRRVAGYVLLPLALVGGLALCAWLVVTDPPTDEPPRGSGR